METVDVDEVIIAKLRKSGISIKMKSLENCDFLIIIEQKGEIVGAGGVGGIFHVPSLQIHEEYQKKGLGTIIFDKTIAEAKKRKYSFLFGSRNPENINAVKIHNYYKLNPIFQIKYKSEFTRDIVFLEFNYKGKLIKKILKIFNTKIGMTFFIISIKILKSTLLKILFTYPPEEFPNPDITYAIKNFKKL
jgi:GNAT superfamily N-acetyltransferase